MNQDWVPVLGIMVAATVSVVTAVIATLHAKRLQLAIKAPRAFAETSTLVGRHAAPGPQAAGIRKYASKSGALARTLDPEVAARIDELIGEDSTTTPENEGATSTEVPVQRKVAFQRPPTSTPQWSEVAPAAARPPQPSAPLPPQRSAESWTSEPSPQRSTPSPQRSAPSPQQRSAEPWTAEPSPQRSDEASAVDAPEDVIGAPMEESAGGRWWDDEKY